MVNNNNSKKTNLSSIEIFYENIKHKAEKLISKKKFKEAEAILIDELEAPYIPKNYYEILENLLSDVRFELYYLKDNVEIESLPRDALLAKVFNSNKIDYNALQLYFERFSQSFVEEDFVFFEDILTNKKIRNYDKELIFQMFVNSKIKCNLRFFNTNLKEEFVVDSSTTKTFHSIDLYQNTQNLISQMADKEISLLNFCEEILFLIYKFYFPLIPSYDFKTLAFSIFSYMLYSLQGEKIEKNEITELIEKIISENQNNKKNN